MKWRYLFWVGALFLLASFATQIPLFNILGFEFSLLMSAAIAIASGHITVRLANPLRPTIGRPRTPSSLFVIALAINFSLLILPLIIILLNAFRVKNCDLSSGFAFFGLMPLTTCIYATAAALFFRLISKTDRRGYLLFISYLTITVVIGVYHLIFHPPKFFYHSVIGYFPGPIYDEEIKITAALIVSRVRTLLSASAFLLSSTLLFEGQPLSSEERAISGLIGRFYRRRLSLGDFMLRLLLFGILSTLYLIYIYRGDLGIQVSRSYIQNELGGKRSTEHFDIYYDRRSRAAKEVDLIAQDHEFRYWQLAQFFKLQPKGKIRSYVYASADQKKRLMGAKNTSMEDPINSEIHINYQPFPHSVLKHELAHLFCGNFHPFFKFSLKVGLHEGIAVAAEWDEGDLTAHQLSKAMVGSVKKLMGAFGFWTQPSSKSYTLSGSFVRYLVDTYGIEKFKDLFPTGNFKKHYRKSLDELIAEWEEFLDGVLVSPSEVKSVEHRLTAVGIFQKSCAHESAEVENEAWLKYRNGDYVSAISDFQKLRHFSQNDLRGLRGIMLSHYAAKEYDKSTSFANQVISHRNSKAQNIVEAKNLIGNSNWQKGNVEEAENLFLEIYQMHISSDYNREMVVKLEALKFPEISDLMKEALISDESSQVKMLKLKEIVEIKPDFASGYYLIGQQLHFARSYDDSIRYLQKAEELGLSDQSLVIENWRLIGLGKFMIGAYDDAVEYFDKVAAMVQHEGQVLKAKDWIERCLYQQGQGTGKK